ncbi:MAG: hypothetical protein AB7F79_02275 [Steroidobacteraceae bacterium]
MKIFEKIVSIEPSVHEKDRIAKALLDSDTLLYRVFTTAAPSIHDHVFWRRAQKEFKVRGFRDGNPMAIQMVITRAIEYVRQQSGPQNQASWYKISPLYIGSVHAYLAHDLSPLHVLLTNEDYQPGAGTLTEQVLRSVVKSLPLYDATLEQIRELYEIWGFDRTEHANEILANAYVHADALRRVVSSSAGIVRREFASAMATTKSDIYRTIDQHTSEIESLRIQLKDVQVELHDAVAALPNAASATTNEPSPSHPSLTQNKPANLDNVAMGPARMQQQQLIEAVDALRRRVEGLGKQLKEIRNQHRPTMRTAHPAVESSRSGIQTTTALATIQKWLPTYADAGIVANNVASAWIILELIRRSRVLITDKPALFVSLMASLPVGELRRIVASPLWLTDADWKDSLSFISVDDGVPKLLIIEDFDVALQDAYLVPALVGWQSSLNDQCANRVVLVPADTELQSVSPRLFEIATLLTHDAVHIRDLKRLASTISDLPPTLEMVHAASTVVGYSRNKNVSSEDQLKQYAANYGVSLPTRLVENFVSMYEGLHSFLRSRDAGFVAQQSILMPWIAQSRGEMVSGKLDEALKRIFDAE